MFNPSPIEIQNFNQTLSAIVGTPTKKLDGELKKDMSYYFIIDIPNFKIVDYKGLDHFFMVGENPNLGDTIFRHIIPTNFFFYINSAICIYSILIKEKRFLKEMLDASYTIEYLIKNKYDKIMHVKQLAIALDLDENDLLSTNLTRCIVMEHSYEGSILRDYTPRITMNFERMIDLEEEIKERIANVFYSKMKETLTTKRGKLILEEEKNIAFTRKEVEYLKLIAQKYSNDDIAKIMGVSDDRIKQYRKGIRWKMDCIFQWPENMVKKFEELADFMEKNGLLKTKSIDLLYP